MIRRFQNPKVITTAVSILALLATSCGNRTATVANERTSEHSTVEASESSAERSSSSQGFELMNFSPSDVNTNGFDMADYVRADLGYHRVAALIAAQKDLLATAWGIKSTVSMAGSPLDVAPVGSKDGKVDIQDAIANAQDYLDKVWDYGDHTYGVQKTANAINRCLNNKDCNRADANFVKMYDIDMNGSVEPMDVLLLANFKSCIDGLRYAIPLNSSAKVSEALLKKYCKY